MKINVWAEETKETITENSLLVFISFKSYVTDRISFVISFRISFRIIELLK